MLSTLLFQAMNFLVRDAHPSHNEAPSAGMPTSEPGGFVQLTVITPYRQHTISLNALAIAVKADILIEIKTCEWCGDEFVPAARHLQFCKPAVGRLHSGSPLDDAIVGLTGNAALNFDVTSGTGTTSSTPSPTLAPHH